MCRNNPQVKIHILKITNKKTLLQMIKILNLESIYEALLKMISLNQCLERHFLINSMEMHLRAKSKNLLSAILKFFKWYFKFFFYVSEKYQYNCNRSSNIQ